jgi:dihydroneopterin aldolase
MDTIYVNDIRAYGYTGAFVEENNLGQWFCVDLALNIDLDPAGVSDDLDDTYNYGQAVDIVHQRVRQHPFKLIETLASEIAKAVLQSDDRLTQVTVKLTKPTPPIPDFTGSVSIEITRDRTHLTRPAPKQISQFAEAHLTEGTSEK